MKRIFTPSKIFIGIIFLILAGILILSGFSSWIVEWLWLENLGYEQVFWSIKTTQILLWAGALIAALSYVLPNMNALAKRFGTMSFGNSPLAQLNLHQVSTKKIRTVFLSIGSVFSLFFSLAFFMRWDTYFRFHWDQSFGQADPVFGHDIGFYVFRLPFIELVQNSLVSLVFFVTVIIIVLYVYSGAISLTSKNRISAPANIKKQISLNLGLWFLLLSWGYYLDRYNLLYNSNGAVYGASYVDINVKLPILWIIFVLCLLLAALSFYQLYKNRLKWLLTAGITTLLIGAIGLNILPGLVQSFSVEPSELELETPYIEHSIEQTRKAYALDQIKTQSYSAQPAEALTWPMINKNAETIENIRLWDPRLLVQTYRQLQEIRLYYQFYNVDVDRYQTNEGYMQMMVAARELTEELPEQSDTWVNRRLQYTHGYGMVMSPVAQEGSQGDPRMVIRDIPPTSEIDLQVEQPALYYGEHNGDYKIVDTNIRELDYPSGDKNVYTNYKGSGGVSINNFFEQLLFAWQFSDINILLTDYINENSQIIFWKKIEERVSRIAPFLRLEDDPYLVLNEGKLYWMQDAYTTSPDYPYSEPFNNEYNYIRNSVKVVVDAYEGTTDFYISDEDDPVLKVYRDIFPGLFKSLDEMPEGLRSHLRYPIYLFETQMDKFNKYHMTNPQVFYNNEDLWSRPNETYAGRKITMSPYYVLTKLPGEEKLQYLLISPLTPDNRDNMISWMAANSDYPNYGEVLVYELPKDRLILGPAQIEARIEQDTEISRQLALWDQRGSSVIRGNLMVIPIEDSFIYVEPLFLIAEGVDIPQLQRVIVTSGEKIAMQRTLWQSIEALHGKRKRIAAPSDTAAAAAVPAIPLSADTSAIELSQLRTLWEEANEAMQNGNWSLFGEKMNEISEMLEDN